MDYKDLANLIFPDAKEISYYEEKYPRRELKEDLITSFTIFKSCQEFSITLSKENNTSV